jgi:hypothetical protein
VRLGKRSARIGSGKRGQLIRYCLGVLLAGGVLVALANAQPAGAPPAAGQPIPGQPVPGPSMPGQPATVGPMRIVCNAAFCQMGSGARPKERYRVIVSDLTRDEIHRLRKCTGVAKPCIVTIEGVEQGGPMRIMATTIHWQQD